ncbi:MAG: hypothetical protein KKH80_01400 [Candidatus Omnitrophica bacterium]|nr:hypothetical protein [Candidatus Omnitrophota bacterium]
MTSLIPLSSKIPKSYFLKIFAFLIILLINGCSPKEDVNLYSKNEAEKKFIQICKDEYGWELNTQLINNSFWIYLPYQKDIFQFKANRFSQKSSFAVSYLEGTLSDSLLQIEYQIDPLMKSEEDKGFTYGLMEEISEDFQNVLNTIYRVYFNAEQQPEFYVIVMADIVNGVEIIYTIYSLDLIKIYNYALPSEESYKRVLQEIKGNLAITNDKSGRHLFREEITFPEFLIKQIIQRIRYKLMEANLELKEENALNEEIMKIISYCVSTYEFRDFSKVSLNDLSGSKEITRSRSDLEKIKEF